MKKKYLDGTKKAPTLENRGWWWQMKPHRRRDTWSTSRSPQRWFHEADGGIRRQKPHFISITTTTLSHTSKLILFTAAGALPPAGGQREAKPAPHLHHRHREKQRWRELRRSHTLIGCSDSNALSLASFPSETQERGGGKVKTSSVMGLAFCLEYLFMCRQNSNKIQNIS